METIIAQLLSDYGLIGLIIVLAGLFTVKYLWPFFRDTAWPNYEARQKERHDLEMEARRSEIRKDRELADNYHQVRLQLRAFSEMMAALGEMASQLLNLAVQNNTILEGMDNDMPAKIGRITSDGTGRVVAADEHAAALLNLPSAALIGEMIAVIDTNGNRLQEQQNPFVVAAGGTVAHTQMIGMSIGRMPGVTVWVLAGFRPVRDDAGNITGSVAFITGGCKGRVAIEERLLLS